MEGEKIEHTKDALEKKVENEIEHSGSSQQVSSASLLAQNDIPKYWRTGRCPRFKHLRSVAQRVFGNHAFATQIERHFNSAGHLLSRESHGRYKCRDAALVHLNFNQIPPHIPAVPNAVIPMLLPKRFTGKEGSPTRRSEDILRTGSRIHRRRSNGVNDAARQS